MCTQTKCLHADDYLKDRTKARIGEERSNLESEAETSLGWQQRKER